MTVDQNLLDLLSQQHAVTVGFSCGKDSLCVTKICLDLGLKVYPFYFYHVPDLEFVNDQIKRYEDLFGFKIVQMPHPMLYDSIRRQDFASYRLAVWLNSFDWVHLTFEEMVRAYLYDCGVENAGELYDAVGMRASESFNRRKVFEKYGPIQQRHGQHKIFPIWNWKKKDVLDYLQSKRIPLTNDYNIWDRSWDGIKYQFLRGVKTNYPKDYQTITEYFELIESELLRYEFNKQHLG